MNPLQAEEIFASLDRHGVRYVLVGGLAAVLHGSPLPTLDADSARWATRRERALYVSYLEPKP